jgi:crotonobetainyl-CoA:carnitine CoA-transferase CaiB-like acyl-CoA transferase
VTDDLNFLAGVRVVDLTQYESGPACTLALAWMGAEVVKVESPRGGDPGRSSGAPPGVDGHWFQQWNVNKKSVALNLKSAAGVAVLKQLVGKADIFVENFRPGGIEGMGLGYDVLGAGNPGLIYAQLQGFGAGSPFESNLSFDTIGQATGGSMSVSGERDRPPVKPGATVADAGTGMTLAISILGALYRRKATGEGAHIQVAMQDSVMHYLRGAFAATSRTGKPAPRNGAKSPGVLNVPSNIYPCKPGGPNDYVYVYPNRNNATHWHRLLEVIGRADLIGDARFETAAARGEREAEVDGMIASWTSQRDKHEAMRVIGEAGIPAGAILDTLELQNDPTFERRGIIQTVEHPQLGAFKMSTWPARFDGSTARIKPAPALGRDTHAVLREWLDLQAHDIDVLSRDGGL